MLPSAQLTFVTLQAVALAIQMHAPSKAMSDGKCPAANASPSDGGFGECSWFLEGHTDVLTVLLVLIVAQNTAPVQARFLWLAGEISAIVLLFLAAAGGFVLGLLVAIFVRSGLKSS